ncbi:MAG: exodeoxyribonuclease I [Spirochaetia bacterium]|nr:exodeoxyribonuclease I [Spirochaetia bacterium]
MGESLFWYDLETFGTNPRIDRIAQFAGIRTNDRFEPIEDPVVLYCKITPDYLPDPAACLVTGITPNETLRKGIGEYDFIRTINEIFSVPGTTVVGFNNIRFDDEFIRNALYRNLLDPYEREYKNGNARYDMIDLIRMAHDLRPEGIEWPVEEETGRVTFRLEKLTAANGLSHEHAHDALSDVYATVAVAKLLFEKQPKLFRYEFGMRRKKTVQDFHTEGKPFLFTSPLFSRPEGCTTVVFPLATDPTRSNCSLVYDLRYDPEEFISMTEDELAHRLYSRSEILEAENAVRLPVKELFFNRAPAVAPLSVLDEAAAGRLKIDVPRCLAYAARLKKAVREEGLLTRIRNLYDRDRRFSSGQTEGGLLEHSPAPPVFDPDLLIYSDFFGDADRERMARARSLSPEEILTTRFDFDDARLNEMLFRFVCRNYYGSLNEATRAKWKSFCAQRLLVPPQDHLINFSFYMRKIDERLASRDIAPGDKVILKELRDYGRRLEREILGKSGD